MQKRAHSSEQPVWKPLVIAPDAAMARLIRSALSEQGFDDVVASTAYPRNGEIRSLVEQRGYNVCFLDVASHPENALAAITEIAPAIPVVVVNPCNNADLILRCLRLGAAEFLADVTGEQVGAALERLDRLRVPAVATKAGKVYCVLPGKPGCGASTLAAYLAMELRHSGAAKVLLVDTDFVTASIGFIFKLKSDFHLGDAVRDWSRMDDDLWSRLTVPYQGVDILLAPPSAVAPLELDDEEATELLSFWQRHYEAIVIDLPGAHCAGFRFVGAADEVLLVTTNELAALHSTRRSMECLEKYRPRVKLLVTRYTPHTGLKRDDVQMALKVEPWALLSNDYEGVQAALLEGKPVAPGSYLGKSIRALAERLMGKPETPKKRSPLFGLLPLRN
jgi:Flp pilus assembly CpaE family ATPase